MGRSYNVNKARIDLNKGYGASSYLEETTKLGFLAIFQLSKWPSRTILLICHIIVVG